MPTTKDPRYALAARVKKLEERVEELTEAYVDCMSSVVAIVQMVERASAKVDEKPKIVVPGQ